MPLDDLPADTNVVRIVANDPNLTGDQWLAFTPPRVPTLETLNSVVGSEQPVLLDWAVGLQFPCQRPFDHRYGIARCPITGSCRIVRWRCRRPTRGRPPSSVVPSASPRSWPAPEQVPTYLKDDWARDWGGSLERYTPFYPNATAAEPETTVVTRSGLWNPPGTLRVYE